ncbi:hypothetical protein [Hyalangium versicolor]|uniref:hypothetical protein n=1 Tax=Hyalangium versicolor TaxID=2861190 RepID=UPI001CCD5AE0|nr:hypothetical protein [Hyalangium versicolor]
MIPSTDRVRQSIPKVATAIKKAVTPAINRAQEKLKKEPGLQGKKALDTFTSAKDSLKKAKTQTAAYRSGSDFKSTFKENWSKAGNPDVKLDKASLAKQGSKALGLLDSARKLPGQINTAVADARQGFRQGASVEERDKAIGSVATASKTALGATKSALELGRDATKVGSTYRQASKAFKASVQEAGLETTKSAQRTAARTVTKEVFKGAKQNEIKDAARQAVKNLGDGTRQGVKDVITDGTKQATTKAANKALTQAATNAAEKAVAKTAAKTAAKAAGRFVPGVNVAIAAADAATAFATVRDPKASTTKKVTSVVTAVGSAAAATNIPVVSQVGAAVSTVSSFVGGLFG